ncbi:hypothetical protein [Acinetobacter sp. CFCC 11171]|uniref:hypothetical protein n=1 Tax=Acinetobacter sp. CFCC 11171 TaxID=1775558 RepID=UPI000DCFA546|nr:hypothetical protein [Acinetobacter sp. CFCC 11171]
MKFVQNKADISTVRERPIADAILDTMQMLENQYEEPYQATLHGWFVVCALEPRLLTDRSPPNSPIVRFLFVEDEA